MFNRNVLFSISYNFSDILEWIRELTENVEIILFYYLITDQELQREGIS